MWVTSTYLINTKSHQYTSYLFRRNFSFCKSWDVFDAEYVFHARYPAASASAAFGYHLGNCALSIKISDDKASMERRRFRMKVEAVGRPDIEPAVTDKLTVM